VVPTVNILIIAVDIMPRKRAATTKESSTKKTKISSSSSSVSSSSSSLSPSLSSSSSSSSVQPIHTQLFINNTFVPSLSGKTFPVEDPSTGEIICHVAESDAADVELAVGAAEKAFEIGSEWRTMDASFRGQLLYRIADLIERDREYLAHLETRDNGKPYSDSFNVDLALVIKCFRYYAGWCDKLHGKTIPVDGPYFAYTRHEPIGIVGQIIPWNFPALMCAWKLAPAMACGCCIVLKPAEQTPLTALHIASLVAEAGVPSGVLNVVTGYGATTGSAISSHMRINKVAFTGSTGVGKLIMQAAGASNCKAVTLELGGKSPNIVFADADLDKAVEISHHAIFFNQGQCCVAGSRTLVQDTIYDEFVKKAVARALNRKVGHPSSPGVEHGAQVSQRQFDTVMGYIKKGQDEGATLCCGGKKWGNKGYFIEPTVFSNVTPNMIIAREEIFGPVQVIIKFRTIEEAIQIANDSDYGLGGAVITKSLDCAMQVSNQLRAGTVWVNCYDVLAAQCPFGGFKQSGIGRELGEYGLSAYTSVKTVMVKLTTKNT
jgi:acyl-CoA reductase-like NAD-dependent aldehyde dehydrogenase